MIEQKILLILDGHTSRNPITRDLILRELQFSGEDIHDRDLRKTVEVILWKE